MRVVDIWLDGDNALRIGVVDGVFGQFLDDRSGMLDDFTDRDVGGDVWWQYLRVGIGRVAAADVSCVAAPSTGAVSRALVQ